MAGTTTTGRIPQQQTGAIKYTSKDKSGKKYTGWNKAPALKHHGAYNWDVPAQRVNKGKVEPNEPERTWADNPEMIGQPPMSERVGKKYNR